MTDEFATNGNAANNNNIKFDPYTGKPIIQNNTAETSTNDSTAAENTGTANAQAASDFSTPHAQGTVGCGTQSYHAPSYNGGEAPRSGEYSFRPAESRFDPHESIPNRDAFSGNAFGAANAGTPNAAGTGAPMQPPYNAKAGSGKKKAERRGLGKGGIARLRRRNARGRQRRRKHRYL